MTTVLPSRQPLSSSTAAATDSLPVIDTHHSVMGSGEKKSYTLTYFDVRGRAEPSRMLFALAGVKFTDRRLNYQQWMEFKPRKSL